MFPYSLEASIRSHFRFLLDNYGFSITKELYKQEMGNAIILFTNLHTCIELVKDRGQILVSFGDHQLERREWVEFAQAVNFFSGNTGPVYSFPSQYNDETEEIQVSHVSSIMQKHCTPILSGTMTVIQLLEAIRSQRAQEARKFLDNFQRNQNPNQSS